MLAQPDRETQTDRGKSREKRQTIRPTHTHTHTHTDIQRNSDLATVDKLDGSFTEEEIDEVADLVR